MIASTLDAFLNSYAMSQTGVRPAVAQAVRALASAALKLRAIMGTVGPGGGEALLTGGGADPRRALEARADATFLEAMTNVPVAFYAAEHGGAPTVLDREAQLAVAIQPLDGFSNIDINAALGTIFSVLPTLQEGETETFRQPGRKQLAAGFIVYGPQLGLVLTLGNGTHAFIFSAPLGVFVQARESCIIPAEATEYAINASNYRHWREAVRLYIDDCLSGADGPRNRDFDMRWGASLVAHIYRILMHGGVYLQPADNRPGCAHGHLGLVHQANPIALLVEQAGGAASDTAGPVLDLVPETLHQRTPLICGSLPEVERITRYHTEPSAIADRAPLFGNRGLFRA
ncbi:class 1 fructose-bisphosphatase [Mesorhizobium loti]|uniref:Fructose-1,6-bisphosphatase class 1 n=1 Tax=Mesorhizobium loti R88b TaxID=935548 RepID=A0A6M7WTF6_RHILI|nr:class 1 fructose-bisphosphatase [Mesorhizobium loti]QKD05265.1 class 1 fructose-bisphosphatase [Mesorhizobium loti R88b]